MQKLDGRKRVHGILTTWKKSAASGIEIERCLHSLTILIAQKYSRLSILIVLSLQIADRLEWTKKKKQMLEAEAV